ncbi:hypothetical protein [Marinobacter xestospongiae]|uniref:hypothetical protein n=1 Tax=Marinobacter xestospongiae TaxID=994319 RepID=UPI0020048DD6|nr:hypothetical protein [Marinobacter xestospongiae]MCK7568956.1 hypothetical protein [Marinobacter xestospongiae]
MTDDSGKLPETGHDAPEYAMNAQLLAAAYAGGGEYAGNHFHFLFLYVCVVGIAL